LIYCYRLFGEGLCFSKADFVETNVPGEGVLCRTPKVRCLHASVCVTSVADAAVANSNADAVAIGDAT